MGSDAHPPSCELCDGDGGALIVRHDKWRIVQVGGVEGAAYGGFCRVVWNAHVKEMSDLSVTEQQQFMAAVFALEAVLRESLKPDKMNLASLGNLTPHLHWHVIPRYQTDGAFPKPIWAVATPTSPKNFSGNTANADWVSAVKRRFAAPNFHQEP